jgi:zinc transport system substrate-binding protein
MRKLLNLLGLCISLLFLSCTGKPTTKPIVTVTTQPQAFFAERIAGKHFQIHVMVPNGSSPESYDPTPNQMVTLSKSRAYFLIGHIGFELAWKDKLRQNNPEMTIFDNSQGVELIEGDHYCEGHNHHDEFIESLHSGIDPHIWTSPKSALIMAKNMLDAFIILDPRNEAEYTENYENLKSLILEVDAAIIEKLEAAPSRTFLIYHPSLGYLARDYGLEQLSIEMDGKEPTPKRLKELMDRAQSASPQIVFIQPEFDTKNAFLVADQLKLKIVQINPLAYNWDKEIIRIVDLLCE